MKANVKAKSEDKRTSLHIASEKGNLDVIKYLVEQGADMEAKDLRGSNTTALRKACYYGSLDIFKYLVE